MTVQKQVFRMCGTNGDRLIVDVAGNGNGEPPLFYVRVAESDDSFKETELEPHKIETLIESLQSALREVKAG